MGHLYQTSAHHQEAQGPLQRGRKKVRARGGGGGYDVLSLGYNVAILLMNSLQMQLAVQDPNKTKPTRTVAIPTSRAKWDSVGY